MCVAHSLLSTLGKRRAPVGRSQSSWYHLRNPDGTGLQLTNPNTDWFDNYPLMHFTTKLVGTDRALTLRNGMNIHIIVLIVVHQHKSVLYIFTGVHVLIKIQVVLLLVCAGECVECV